MRLEVLGFEGRTASWSGCLGLEAIGHHVLALPILTVLADGLCVQREMSLGVSHGIDWEITKADFFDLNALPLHFVRQLDDEFIAIQSSGRNSHRERVGIHSEVIDAILVAEILLAINLSHSHALEESAIRGALPGNRIRLMSMMGMMFVRMVRLVGTMRRLVMGVRSTRMVAALDNGIGLLVDTVGAHPIVAIELARLFLELLDVSTKRSGRHLPANSLGRSCLHLCQTSRSVAKLTLNRMCSAAGFHLMPR